MSTNPLCLLCASPANTRMVARFLVCNDLSLGRSVGRFIAARGDDFIHQSHADALTMWLTLPAICSNKVTKINVLKILHSQSFKLIYRIHGAAVHKICTFSTKERLFVAYQGEKELYLTDGDHHSSRTPACRPHPSRCHRLSNDHCITALQAARDALPLQSFPFATLGTDLGIEMCRFKMICCTT